jgi:hypothetical protein
MRELVAADGKTVCTQGSEIENVVATVAQEVMAQKG